MLSMALDWIRITQKVALGNFQIFPTGDLDIAGVTFHHQGSMAKGFNRRRLISELPVSGIRRTFSLQGTVEYPVSKHLGRLRPPETGPVHRPGDLAVHDLLDGIDFRYTEQTACDMAFDSRNKSGNIGMPQTRTNRVMHHDPVIVPGIERLKTAAH